MLTRCKMSLFISTHPPSIFNINASLLLLKKKNKSINRYFTCISWDGFLWLCLLHIIGLKITVNKIHVNIFGTVVWLECLCMPKKFYKVGPRMLKQGHAFCQILGRFDTSLVLKGNSFGCGSIQTLSFPLTKCTNTLALIFAHLCTCSLAYFPQ